MNTAIIVGAAGFAGYHLTRALSEHGYKVYAVVRPDSLHNARINGLPNVQCIESTAVDAVGIASRINEPCDFLVNLVWQPAGRYDYKGQMESAYIAAKTLETASLLGCRRYVGIGSQAEYGVSSGIIEEASAEVHPFCGYGVAKAAACFFTKQRAEELNIEWVWGRIFSIYGRYEPEGRLLPFILNCCRNKTDIALSSCRQNWDFLYGPDAGEEILAMAERGRNGEIYNIADGRYRPLKEFVEEAVGLFGNRIRVTYGNDPDPFISLKPSVEKIQRDTGWYPQTSFRDGITELMRENK